MANTPDTRLGNNTDENFGARGFSGRGTEEGKVTTLAQLCDPRSATPRTTLNDLIGPGVKWLEQAEARYASFALFGSIGEWIDRAVARSQHRIEKGK